MTIKIFIILFYLLLCNCSNSFSQANVEWFRTYSAGWGKNFVNDFAMDSLGNTYLTGNVSMSASNSITAFGTVKYNSNGDLQWAKLYQGSQMRLDAAEAIVVDKVGNVYVTGTSEDIDSSDNICTIKYNSNGDIIWIRKFQEAQGTRDFASDITLDNEGNIYIIGNTYYHYVNTIKYDSSGNLLWISHFDENLNVSKNTVSLTVDNLNNVYSTGTVYGTLSQSDFFTVKYNPNGKQQWASFFNNANLIDLPTEIRLDQHGNVFVLGKSFLNSSYDEFYTTLVKYDNDGNQKWFFKTDSIGLRGGFYNNKLSFRIDSSGNSYIGTSYKQNCSLLKLDSNGNLIWNSKFNGQPSYMSAIGRAVDIDTDGFIYVNGSAIKPLGLNDFCTLKYNSEGILIWERTFHTAVNSDDISSFIRVNNSGNVYVSGIGYNSNEGRERFCVVKFSQSVGIQNISSEIPNNFNLYQNYPNPFNPKTIIRFDVTPLNPPFEKGGTGEFVLLKVYDILGNEVRTLVNEKKSAGTYEVDFEGNDLASGVYYYNLSAGNFSRTKRMVLLK